MARRASRGAAPAGKALMTHETAFTMDTSSIKYGP